MIRILLTSLLTLTLSGCLNTLPKWPDRPEEVSTPCSELKLVPEGTTKLSDVLAVINDNYAEYHKCRIRLELWNKWYDKQKKNYEEVDDD
jgi:hypothetical protein